MNLKLTKLTLDGLHKVLVIDQDRSKEEGRMLGLFEANTPEEAMGHALDFCRAIDLSSPETVWN